MRDDLDGLSRPAPIDVSFRRLIQGGRARARARVRVRVRGRGGRGREGELGVRVDAGESSLIVRVGSISAGIRRFRRGRVSGWVKMRV